MAASLFGRSPLMQGDPNTFAGSLGSFSTPDFGMFGYGADPTQKPYYQTTAGKLSAAGQIISSRGQTNPAAQASQQQDELAILQRRAQMQNALELQRQLALAQFNVQNRAPDEFTQTLINAGIDPKSPQGIAAYNSRIQHWNDPNVTMTFPNGQVYSGPTSGLAGALGGAQAPGGPQEGQTATNPTTGERLVYRNGTWQALGGTGGNVSGGFPRSY